MDRLLTAEEVADRLGVRTDWVWAQARAGRIPHVRLGRYRRFRESALEAWICGLEAASTKPSQATGNPRAVPLRRSA
ncbi:MAG: helix-turn-helix domain-containing protein [Solirubrobacteraceae bacterium]